MSSPFSIGQRTSTHSRTSRTRLLRLLTVPVLAVVTACSSTGSNESRALEQEADDGRPHPAHVSLEAERFDGTLEVMVHDDIDGTVAEHHYIELNPQNRLKLVFDSETARELHAAQGSLDGFTRGSQIRVFGKATEQQLFVEHLEVAKEPTRVNGEVDQLRQAFFGGGNQGIGLGDIPVAVILVAFSGTPNNFSPEDMREAIYGSGRSTNTFYLAGSFGGAKLVGIENVEGGDVFGPYTVGGNGCDGGGGYDGAGSEARTMAQNEGHDMDAYEKVLHYFPANAPGCPGGGVGGGRYAFVFGVGLNGAWDYAAHELGHTFGLPHAASYTNCTSGSDVITYGGSCGHDEYGDLTDIMGGRNFQFSSHHLSRLGWLPEGNEVTLEQSARVRLAPIETGSTGVQSLYVNRSGNENYHFEFRQPLNVDERLEQGLTNGVLVRLVNGGNTTHILDMTPNNGFNDAALAEGRTYTDDGIEVTVVEVTSEAAVIDVVIDGAPVDPDDVVGGDGMPVGNGGAPNTGAGGADNAGAGGEDTNGNGMGGDTSSGGSPAGGGMPGMDGSGNGGTLAGGGTPGFPEPEPEDDPTAMAGQSGNPPAGGGGTGNIPSPSTPVGTSSGEPSGIVPTATPSATTTTLPANTTDAEDAGGCGCKVVASETNRRGGPGAMVGFLVLGLALGRRRARA